MKRVILLILISIPFMVSPGPLPVHGEEPAINLPTRTVVTTQDSVPTSVTTTELITTIEPGVWYVIRSVKPLIVLDSPRGSVSIISGATSAEGVFAGGDGKSETRVFDDSQSTYLIQGLKPCTTELILIPQGVTDRADVVRHILTVSGIGPNPPPEPDEPDVPFPDDPPEPDEPVKVESFRVIFVKESGQTLSKEQSSIPAAKVIRDILNAKTTKEEGAPGWREYDPDFAAENEQPTMKALWAAVKPKLLPAPCMVVEVNGHATVMPFPANVDECVATLKKYGGE